MNRWTAARIVALFTAALAATVSFDQHRVNAERARAAEAALRFTNLAADSARSTRGATFELREEPYTISASVEMPPPPDSATLSIRVALDPIHIDARLSCAAPDDHGIRSASIAAASPKWASVRFDRVEQSAELCASPALTPASHRSFIEFRRLMIGVGEVRTAGGQWTVGAFIGPGFAGWI